MNQLIDVLLIDHRNYDYSVYDTVNQDGFREAHRGEVSEAVVERYSYLLLLIGSNELVKDLDVWRAE